MLTVLVAAPSHLMDEAASCLCLLSDDDCVEFELHASYFLYGKDVMQIIDLEHVPASVGYDHNDAVVDDQYFLLI